MSSTWLFPSDTHGSASLGFPAAVEQDAAAAAGGRQEEDDGLAAAAGGSSRLLSTATGFAL